MSVHGMTAQALCTEASLHALRRSYPQIYEADEKLLVDPKAVHVGEKDFEAAQLAITPASHRAAAAPARCWPAVCEHVVWSAPRHQRQLQGHQGSCTKCTQSRHALVTQYMSDAQPHVNYPAVLHMVWPPVTPVLLHADHCQQK